MYTYTSVCICITCVYYNICVGMGVRVLLHRGDEAPITAGHFGVVHPEVFIKAVLY